ncbi:DUF6941 family protein [Brevundimonas diminuta]|uniref:DUF6941 family protein n=1 Tax=Brevundimonas diminuta TaxID=293 RepID=UPI003D9A1127
MPNVKAAIFCDDVRMEANGKLLLIGTYTGKMIVPSFPAQNQIRCVLILDKIDTSHLELTARVSGHAGAEFGELELEIDIEEDTLDDLPAWIPLPPLAFSLSEPDTIELSISLNGGEKMLVGTLPVVLG